LPDHRINAFFLERIVRILTGSSKVAISAHAHYRFVQENSSE